MNRNLILISLISLSLPSFSALAHGPKPSVVPGNRGILERLDVGAEGALDRFVSRAASSRGVQGKIVGVSRNADLNQLRVGDQGAAAMLVRSEVRGETRMTVQGFALDGATGITETTFQLHGNNIQRALEPATPLPVKVFGQSSFEVQFTTSSEGRPQSHRQVVQIVNAGPVEGEGARRPVTSLYEIRTGTNQNSRKAQLTTRENGRMLDVEIYNPTLSNFEIRIDESHGRALHFEINSELNTVTVMTTSGNRLEYGLTREGSTYQARLRTPITRFSTENFIAFETRYRPRTEAGSANGLAPSGSSTAP